MVTPNLPSVQPIDVQETIQEIWGISLQPAGCPRCRKTFLVDAPRVGQPCPACWQGTLQPQPALLRSEPPELLLPFQKGNNDLLPILTRFVQGVWLHGNDFSPENLLKRAQPVYWPMWLVDSDISGDWKAEAGYDYQVKSSQESYRDSRWQTRELVETRIRWEPRLGELRRHYDNAAVPALGDHNDLSKKVGVYQQAQASAYQPERLAQADVRVPDLQPENAWPLAQESLNRIASGECVKAAGAQHVRSFALHAHYDNLHWTQLLLPMFVTYYTDDEGQPHTVYINGQSGATGGERLASQRKGWLWAGILAGSGVAAFLLGLLCFALTVIFPPASIAGTLLALLGIVLILLAIIPAAWPWQWNRSQREQKVVSK